MATYEIKKVGNKFQVFENNELFVWIKFTKKAAVAYIVHLHELEADEIRFKALQKTYQRERVAVYLTERAARPAKPVQISLF